MSYRVTTKCDDCPEATKTMVACWDGQDPNTQEHTYGYHFNCQSETCEMAIGRRQLEKEAAINLEEVKVENAKNGIDIAVLKARRRKSEVNIRQAAVAVGVTASLYSGWENERTAFPPAYYEKLIKCLEQEEKE